MFELVDYAFQPDAGIEEVDARADVYAQKTSRHLGNRKRLPLQLALLHLLRCGMRVEGQVCNKPARRDAELEALGRRAEGGGPVKI